MTSEPQKQQGRAAEGPVSAKGLLPGKVALCLCSSSFFALSSCWMPGFSEHRTPLYHGSALRHGESHTNSSAPGGLRSVSSCPGGEALPVQRPPGEALPTFLSPSPPSTRSSSAAPPTLIREGRSRGMASGSHVGLPKVVSAWVLPDGPWPARARQQQVQGLTVNMLVSSPGFSPGLDPSLCSWGGFWAGGLKASPVTGPNSPWTTGQQPGHFPY